MFCEKCGAPLNEGENTCPVCGTPQTVGYTPSVEPAGQNTTPLLVLGIVALALAELGLPGLILAIIARAKINRYVKDGGQLTGKAKAANILSRIALILSIVMMVVWAIYIVVIVALILSGELENMANEIVINF